MPTSQIFAEGNGGEMRKSFHGYPANVAQLIESPVDFQIDPMQIDTHNRNLTNLRGKFVPGPTPAEAQSPPNALYSGLLECPCTDRRWKNITTRYATTVRGECLTKVSTAKECFASVRNLETTRTTLRKEQEIQDASQPSGCFFNDVDVTFNSYNDGAAATAPCGGGGGGVTGGGATGEVVDAETGVTMSLTVGVNGTSFIKLTGPADVWFGVGLSASSMADTPYAIIIEPSTNKTSGAAGAAGPAAAHVTERKLGDHDPGAVLSPTIIVSSTSSDGKLLTIIMTRPTTTKDYDLAQLVEENASSTLPLIFAVGSTPIFAYHKTHSSNSLSLYSIGNKTTTCMCELGTTGDICGNAVGGCLSFPSDDKQGQDLRGKRCPAFPLSNLAKQNNPTCDVRTYSGGLICCHHRNVLLDKNQTNPWPGQELEYVLRFRFWFQEYKEKTDMSPASHENLIRFYWQTESFAGEYDVPRGDLMMPGTTLVNGMYQYKIESKWKVEDMVWECNPTTSSDRCTGGGNGTTVQLRYAGGHCHAPSCLSIELYNDDTNELLCRQLPVYGSGQVEDDRFDELGYLALPPCLWGTEVEGLVAPVSLTFNTTLRSVKKNNATFGHYGEMASWQMRGVIH